MAALGRFIVRQLGGGPSACRRGSIRGPHIACGGPVCICVRGAPRRMACAVDSYRGGRRFAPTPLWCLHRGRAAELAPFASLTQLKQLRQVRVEARVSSHARRPLCCAPRRHGNRPQRRPSAAVDRLGECMGHGTPAHEERCANAARTTARPAHGGCSPNPERATRSHRHDVANAVNRHPLPLGKGACEPAASRLWGAEKRRAPGRARAKTRALQHLACRSCLSEVQRSETQRVLRRAGGPSIAGKSAQSADRPSEATRRARRRLCRARRRSNAPRTSRTFAKRAGNQTHPRTPCQTRRKTHGRIKARDRPA